MKHPSPCIVHGCPELTPETYCDEHAVARQRRYDRNRGSAAARGYDHAWRKRRIAYLRSQGWRCEQCGVRPADTSRMHVHHIDRDPTGPHRLDPANLEALCESCHNALPEHREPRPARHEARETRTERRVWGL